MTGVLKSQSLLMVISILKMVLLKSLTKKQNENALMN